MVRRCGDAGIADRVSVSKGKDHRILREVGVKTGYYLGGTLRRENAAWQITDVVSILAENLVGSGSQTRGLRQG